MSFYPCPNPLCTHSFTPEQVQSAVALKCPVCGQVFQFRVGAAAKARTPPDAPVKNRQGKSPPSGRIPIAKPVLPPAPSTGTAAHCQAAPPPVPVASAARVANPPTSVQPSGLGTLSGSEPLVQPTVQRAVRPHKLVFFLAVGMVLGAFVLIGAFLAVKAFSLPRGSAILPDKGRVIVGTARSQKNVEENAFKLVLADKAWVPDSDMRRRLGVVTAWKSIARNEEGWLAVSVRDYGLSRPREAELMRSGIEPLEQYFEGSLELADKAEPATLSETLGQRLLFKGQLHAVTWWGHVYMFAHHGLGYWIYVAAPSKAEAEKFGKDLGNGFIFYTERNGWQEQPPKKESFASADGAVTAFAPEGVFVKHPARDQDERGELYLFAKYHKDNDNRKNADVLILALPKDGNAAGEGLKEALRGARKYLEDKKQEESKDYRVDVAAEGEAQADQGVAAAVGNYPGRIAEYKLLHGASAARCWVVAVVKDADKVYAIRCDCAWEHRQIWRADFEELLRSLVFRNGPGLNKENQKAGGNR
jgi:hypothetical protein